MAFDPSALSRSSYTTRRKALLSLVNQLRTIGAQADLDLPCIAVIGNQSAGKSSIIEAISGINVPRDAGTCTRCPMEFRLSSSMNPWSCRISIRWEFDRSGRRLDEIREVPFGEEISDHGVVELALRRAQSAVLNPQIPPTQFLSMSKAELTSAQRVVDFSRNMLCVEISGPDMPELSFIDLPGIIQNAEPHIVAMIEELVVSHIRGNCLILVALPMTDDIENQKALRLTREVDPSGSRTIGVLTKPDMLHPGMSTLSIWLDVMEGRRHPLSHGYFCTRHPDDKERGRTLNDEQARNAEVDFFSRTPPWSSSTVRDRCGTTNLVSTLSDLLTQIIDESCPRLKLEARSGLAQCLATLAALPKPIEEEPTTYILGLLTSLNIDFHGYVNGGPGNERLIHGNNDSFTTFKRAIRGTAPRFMPYPDVNSHPTDATIPCSADEGEDEEGELMPGQQTLYLKDLRRLIDRSITRELPNNIPFSVKSSLIKSFQTSWDASIQACFDNVRKRTVDVLYDCLASSVRQHKKLHALLRSSISELVQNMSETCLGHVKVLQEVEQTPYTQNTHYLQSCKEKWLWIYKEAKATKAKTVPQTLGVNSPLSTGMATLFGAGYGGAMTTWPTVFGNEDGNTKLLSGVFGDLKRPSLPGTSDDRGLVWLPSAYGDGRSTTLILGIDESPEEMRVRAIRSTIAGKLGEYIEYERERFDDADRALDELLSVAQSHPEGISIDELRSQMSSFLMRMYEPLPAFVPHPSKSKLPAWGGPMGSTPATTSTGFSAPTSSGVNVMDMAKVQAALTALADIGYTGLHVEDLGRLHSYDEYEREMEVMAEVRAYFQVAYKRIIDHIPMFIDLVFVKGMARELQPFLISKIGLVSPGASERCASLLAEDREIVNKRDEMLARKKRLDMVVTELDAFFCN
ncbi:hypothetical protein JAAARDRAFT_158878 [Jaapia argillacea MUCL 33604]|uniref:GED domain-containing protein n=1 Tax=Jaapia argillacea MUCL 33604 TaxID=933084 RepID=A0A067Q0J8_9AGAM|nr:hypothetical protein JAAARDRAFT_158878 [Jaapia argillacea MUCL 33604]